MTERQTLKPKRTINDDVAKKLFGIQEDSPADASAKAPSKKKIKTTLYFTEALRDALDKAADEEGTTRNEYILSVLKANLRKNGFIK